MMMHGLANFKCLVHSYKQKRLGSRNKRKAEEFPVRKAYEKKVSS
jgi:hypothetical protein